MSSIILGIDISKAKFHVSLVIDNGKPRVKAFANQSEGFAALRQWLKGQGVEQGHACLESTSIYGNALARFLHPLGYQVSIVNPARVKGFMQSQLSRTKNDRADATAIARFCAMHQPAPWTPVPPGVEQLQCLTRRLQAIAGMIAQEKNRLETATLEMVPMIQAHIKFLQAQAKQVRLLLHQHTQSDATLKQQMLLLQSIPSIGVTTAAILLAELGDIQRFGNARQVAAFAGLTPQERESGTSLSGKPRLCKIGSARIRKALFLPALTAMRHNPPIQALRERLLQAGKPKMQVVGAAMHKLLRIAYGVLKSGKPFDPNLLSPAPTT